MFSKFKKIALVSTMFLSASALANDASSANVMAPLEVSNWGEFENQLSTAKNIGVTGVSVDIWWGKVEGAGDQQFDWTYYDTIFQKIENAGLDIVPIMSFHGCGGNVGDTCDIPIPSWIWNHYNSQGVNPSDLKYKSEYGNEAVETVSLWQDAHVLAEYREFMEAFESHFSSKASSMSEINISMGSAGELRYPSYNGHDNGLTGYPTRGGFQSYSEPAKQDFRTWTIAKYGNVAGINNSWGTTLSNSNDINPPSDGNSFINNGDQYNTQYGKDFIRWYHNALMSHGTRMMDNAIVSFDGAFANVELGFKIPGIHWKMSANDNTVRSAEIAAGLIPSDIDLNTDATGHGYQDIVGIAAAYNNSGRKVVLHFTALEMDNNPSSGESLAQSLVFWVANEAARQGVTIKGENALAGLVTANNGWDNIQNAFDFASYSGMTVLRINQVTGGGTGQSRYQNFITNNLVEEQNPNEDWQRTVIFIYGPTTSGQDMFIRGGIDHNYGNTVLGKNCQTTNFECAIPIRHNNLNNNTTAGWKGGDTHLDWYGIEANQGSGAQGTALDWTTNFWPSSWGAKRTVPVDGYGESVLNTLGSDYWMLDIEVECSATANGWFEVKSFISNGPAWESDVTQPGAPYTTGNHFAQCGKMNIFERGVNNATISNF